MTADRAPPRAAVECREAVVRHRVMHRRRVELAVGLGLVLGPLAYALTLEPRVVEVVERIEVERVAPARAGSDLGATVVPDAPRPARAPAPPRAAVAAGPGHAGDDRIAFALVNEAGVVLSAAAESAWGAGRLRAHPGPGEYRAAKRADGRVVPDALWRQRGRTFDLYGTEGKVCTARLGALSVLAQHDGPSLDDLFWDDDAPVEALDRPPSAASREQIRARVWSLASSGSLPDEAAPWLVATILGEGSCEGARWARDATLPAPLVLRPSGAPSALTRRRIAQFEGSAELAERRAHFEKWRAELDDASEDWADTVRQYPAQVRTWLDDADRPRLLELSFGDPGEGCGEGFDSHITRFERVVDGGEDEVSLPVAPLAVIDIDLDGHLEMLYEEDRWGETALLSEDDAAPRRSWTVYAVPSCRC